MKAIERWVRDELGLPCESLAPASSDASFRRYFRVSCPGRSYIVMDAPPDKEDVHPYLHVAALFHGIGLHVPEILEQDLAQGFLLLTDLGDTQYLSRLGPDSADRLYGDALEALLTLQRHRACAQDGLPPYDEPLLQREMALFRDWFLDAWLGVDVRGEAQVVLEQSFSVLARSALEQPAVCVHRDYHSRNLMVVPQNNPGVLDFQDAVIGPITYDLVSLLRDCYIAWPREQVEGWVRDYHECLNTSGLVPGVAPAQFLRWFDWMGVQRHLKAIGIFARLNLRDHKPGYLQDIPRTMDYVLEVSGRYSGLRPLHDFLCSRVVPRMVVQGMDAQRQPASCP